MLRKKRPDEENVSMGAVCVCVCLCVACVHLWWMMGWWVMTAASSLRGDCREIGVMWVNSAGCWALCVHGGAFGRRSRSAASSCVLLTNTMTSASVSDATSLLLICAVMWFLSFCLFVKAAPLWGLSGLSWVHPWCSLSFSRSLWASWHFCVFSC